MNNLLMLFFVAFLSANALAQSSEPHNYKPAAGYVPDAATAVASQLQKSPEMMPPFVALAMASK
ncbi:MULTISPECIES: hypothetical protein [unclassified Duganella]|uniref:hypothetical protein n=1 Tax=unclassified Duganella TaxID=2636909 RepID=UPI0006F9D416|nr:MULTISPECIES: hypothetical protein [unclassified Duganella]KQV51040.1 hypothetical protein ASD07_08970 [Duganella sp. Root336D2]KQZ40011.1 hypothetical protein ASD58_06420 [Duganella sp. Root1480D1]